MSEKVDRDKQIEDYEAERKAHAETKAKLEAEKALSDQLAEHIDRTNCVCNLTYIGKCEQCQALARHAELRRGE